jgi:nitroreductase
MDVIEAIKNRRSIRKYKAEPPSREDISAVLEAGRWAPSWANTQCWEFIIIKDPETKEKLAATVPEINPARPAFTQAQVIIVACAQKKKSGCFKGEPATDKGDWLMFDTALALQNLTLAAHARGLGTVHVGLFDSEKVEEILQVPSGVTVVELLPLGYPDEEARIPSRKAIDSFVFHESYGQKLQ